MAQEMVKITGAKKPPRKRQAHQEWSAHIIEVDSKGKPVTNFIKYCRSKVTERWNATASTRVGTKDADASPTAAFRGAITLEYFRSLPTADQELWAQKALDRSTEAKEEWKRKMTEEPSKDPQEVQTWVQYRFLAAMLCVKLTSVDFRCIDNLPRFAAPWMEGIRKRTGLHVTLIVGGPMPKFGGEIGTIQ